MIFPSLVGNSVQLSQIAFDPEYYVRVTVLFSDVLVMTLLIMFAQRSRT